MTCIELFAGAGGASLGLRRAGFRSLLAVEWDSVACASLRAAGFTRVHEGDVREASFAGVGPIDLLWASPPCQAFSNMGKRLGAFDERNGWPWTFDALDRLDASSSTPTWVVCENVPGILLHGARCTQDHASCRRCYWDQVVLPAFQRRYEHVSYRMLNAADYGVPQHRERVFLVAGPVPFAWPKPTHSRQALLAAKWRTGEYWTTRGLPQPAGPSAQEAEEVGLALLTGDIPTEAPWVTVRDVLGLTKAIRVENTGAVSRTVDDVAPTVGTRGVIYTHPVAGERCGPTNRIRPWAVEVAPSTSRDDWLSVLDGLDEVGVFRAPEDRRRLTASECARLQGFSEEHLFFGSSDAQHRQVGNAVPPALARHVAEAVGASR